MSHWRGVKWYDSVAQFGYAARARLSLLRWVVRVRWKGRAGPPRIQADQVDGGGGEGVFEVDFPSPV
jgi:hypothetical protein